VRTKRKIYRRPKTRLERPANWSDVPMYVDPAYLCMFLGLGYETICRKIRSGEIRGKKVGTAWRISREAIREYMEGD
jgi:excisionase family DNA binding protein